MSGVYIRHRERAESHQFSFDMLANHINLTSQTTLPVTFFGKGPCPSRRTTGAGGFDLILPDPVFLKSGEATEVPLDIGVNLVQPFIGLLKERSSAAKKGICVLGGVIDSDYRGYIKLILLNISTEDHWFDRGTSIVQLLIVPSAQVDSRFVSNQPHTGFGSSGLT